MLKVKLKKTVDESYEIIVEAGLSKRIPALLVRRYPASRYVIIADRITEKLIGKKLESGLRAKGMQTLLLVVPGGERSKSREEKARIEDLMLKAGCDRKSLVIAVGGGVVGDLAGFVAATYMRGIRYVQVPTTMLAMVDSAIGGKTGIDTALGKNLIGAFCQPEAVLADPALLRALPARQLANGLVEAAKMFMTSDARGFSYLKKHLSSALSGNPEVLARIIARAVAVKAAVVSADEKEGGKRMVLNFGHTIGHALEKLSGYRILHGEAVALGILVEGRMAMNAGALSRTDYDAIQNLLAALGTHPKILSRFAPSAVVRATKGDKKSVGGHARYVLLTGIGSVKKSGGAYAHAAPDREVLKALRATI
jgi:3-dehydroquinate synthase